MTAAIEGPETAATRSEERGPTTATGLCNGFALRKAVRRVGQLYDAVLAPCGLRATQHSLLSQIGRVGQPTLGELAEIMVMDRSALGHTLKLLERDGLVALLPNHRDRRSRLVALTEAGTAKLADSKRLWAAAQARFESALGTDEAAALRATLAGIASEAFADSFANATDPAMRKERAG